MLESTAGSGEAPGNMSFPRIPMPLWGQRGPGSCLLWAWMFPLRVSISVPRRLWQVSGQGVRDGGSRIGSPGPGCASCVSAGPSRRPHGLRALLCLLCGFRGGKISFQTPPPRPPHRPQSPSWSHSHLLTALSSWRARRHVMYTRVVHLCGLCGVEGTLCCVWGGGMWPEQIRVSPRPACV